MAGPVGDPVDNPVVVMVDCWIVVVIIVVDQSGKVTSQLAIVVMTMRISIGSGGDQVTVRNRRATVAVCAGLGVGRGRLWGQNDDTGVGGWVELGMGG